MRSTSVAALPSRTPRLVVTEGASQTGTPPTIGLGSASLTIASRSPRKLADPNAPSNQLLAWLIRRIWLATGRPVLDRCPRIPKVDYLTSASLTQVAERPICAPMPGSGTSPSRCSGHGRSMSLRAQQNCLLPCRDFCGLPATKRPRRSDRKNAGPLG